MFFSFFPPFDFGYTVILYHRNTPLLYMTEKNAKGYIKTKIFFPR